MKQYGENLLKSGWVVVDLKDFFLNENETMSISNWEATFQQAFNLATEDKIQSGEYRVEHGVSVGYRHDDEREFLETRLTSEGICAPNFTQLNGYSETIVALYSALNRIAVSILNEISVILGWDRNMLIDLTDLLSNGILPYVPCKQAVSKTKESNSDSTETVLEQRIQYSSSLLRICKYAQDSSGSDETTKKSVSFGAHTDSSFITVAPLSSTPGLEVVDQHKNTWICPEQTSECDNTVGPDNGGRVLVFVGEFLQVLTKNRFRATVHRVVAFPTRAAAASSPICRISCPYLIRGRNEAVINMHDIKYQHQPDALSSDKVPDLDDTTMKLLHKLLDLKRQKCFRDNDSKPGNWVLSAFPIENMPEEVEEA